MSIQISIDNEEYIINSKADLNSILHGIEDTFKDKRFKECQIPINKILNILERDDLDNYQKLTKIQQIKKDEIQPLYEQYF